jgi:hypothetical protein
MRASHLALLGCALLTLAACKEQARPAKEAVAQAKGAAADATDTAKAAAADAKAVAQETAASVQAAVHDATVGAEAAASQARAKTEGAVNDAAHAVQGAAATAATSTRAGAQAVAQGVQELGEGGVVTGRVSAVSAEHLRLHPEKSGPEELRLDSHTRYLVSGGTLGKGGLAAGTRVRATYVVEAHVPVATEVEVLPE